MQNSPEWSRLDNAAKIFPPTSTNKETWVFRIACELFEDVDPTVLQKALNKTIKQYPFYTSTIKKGLFWYYFEDSRLIPQVKEESEPPCRRLYNGGQTNLLFEVTYFGKRINLEVYHALSDGTGAMQFLRTMVLYYLKEKHSDVINPDIALADDNAAVDEREQDSFSKYYSSDKGKSLPIQKNAYQIRGRSLPNDRMGIVEGNMSVADILALARTHKATISEYLTTVLISSIYETMNRREQGKPVVVAVPINLRNYFPSGSAKNFFGVANISHNFKTQGTEFSDVLNNVKTAYQQLVTAENMQARLNSLYAVEDNIAARLVPLSIKDIGLRIAEWFSGKKTTVSFSNIGRIEMPDEISKYIDIFDFFTSTKHLQLCLCSYGDNMTISFTSRYKNVNIQRGFFKYLAKEGVDIKITSNIAEQRQED